METSDCERDANFARFRLLYVMRRIPVACAFRGSFEEPFQAIETKQKRAVEIGTSVHFQSPP